MADLFTSDATISTAAHGYAQKAVAFARDRCGVSLDWSDSSIAAVEQVLQTLHEQLPQPPPRQEALNFGKLFGSYLGEVYRRNHGAVWGIVVGDDLAFPGLQGTNGVVFWPWGKVQRRILDGPKENVVAYYAELIEPGRG